ncbi:hypothetical protein BDQ17DRAFT_1349537 [Cyathus striatus]|nr:hypothetical protein BDQ17DRAFT_1349537 [Cyathus striatus]
MHGSHFPMLHYSNTSSNHQKRQIHTSPLVAPAFPQSTPPKSSSNTPLNQSTYQMAY